ncbi:TonB system transport protein ExbD [Bacterioplanoides sp. SCSIO 12839]|uniref:TonB system transport protein ExbD n=1 Tax=Bacterioplanoides sp. SCSIO 12839 TaxID=2829569 RepID=UPI00210573F0|nr:TonB system transport protein ExbD [Bacterioplanoides sp. SCSIO 12839]UTW48256.1 TonB system transport protein ExbD [Bacterioplanoides sp. SCSIO 12839]
MAFNLSDNAGDELLEQHDINVTPFIDVMLVLLIIFMVAAPLATVSVPVNLPTSEAPKQPAENKPLYLTVQKDLTLTLGEKQQVSHEQLATALQAQTSGPDQTIFLRADRKLEYGELMEVMNLLGKAGYHKVALVGLEQLQTDNTTP